MSLGRRKKNSTLLTGSMTVRSFGSRAPPVARLGQDLGRRLAERALVGHRDPQHAVHSFAYTSSRVRPREIISTCVQYRSWLISLGQRVIALVFGGQPHLAGLLEDLLAQSVHAAVERRDRAAACGRVRARSLSSANSASKVFTARDCSTSCVDSVTAVLRARAGRVRCWPWVCAWRGSRRACPPATRPWSPSPTSTRTRRTGPRTARRSRRPGRGARAGRGTSR